MSGRLGAYVLYSNVYQAVYRCDRTLSTSVSLNICNRSNSEATIRVAVSTSATSPTNDEFIEYDVVIGPRGVLERTGITVSPTQYLVVRSNIDNVNAVVFGITMGEESGVSAISSAPVWVTSTSLSDAAAGDTAAIQLQAGSPKNNATSITYTLASGTLPAGTSLSSAGLISGTVSTSGYNAAGVATSFTVTASDGSQSTSRTFNITRRWFDGLTAANAATSAQQIKSLLGTNTDGVYWINLPVVGATQIYCIMDTNWNGGGWMMAMKATTGTTFNFDATYWTVTNTLNPSDNTQNNADAKFHSFNYFGAKDVMARWPGITTGTGGSITGRGVWTWLENDFVGGFRVPLCDFFRNHTSYGSWAYYGANQVPYGGLFKKDAKLFSGWANGVFSSQVDIRFYGFNFRNYPAYGTNALSLIHI